MLNRPEKNTARTYPPSLLSYPTKIWTYSKFGLPKHRQRTKSIRTHHPWLPGKPRLLSVPRVRSMTEQNAKQHPAFPTIGEGTFLAHHDNENFPSTYFFGKKCVKETRGWEYLFVRGNARVVHLQGCTSMAMSFAPSCVFHECRLLRDLRISAGGSAPFGWKLCKHASKQAKASSKFRALETWRFSRSWFELEAKNDLVLFPSLGL
jgi:hypothetical protein